MASRGLRAPGAGSKLTRPGGTGIKAPGRQLARPSPSPSTLGGEGTTAARTAQKRPPAQVQKQPSRAAEPSTNSNADLQVGDSVLVGGVKPGVIAFIGNTQFAPGVWAGVILDSYDGKNDGSVKGVSYFKCEPNRGLFAKPEKLTLVQKGSSQPKSAPPRSQGQTSSAPSFEVGDRILVDGSKPGMVGFIGETHFARGIWAGIVLDEPDGKNSGEVGGVRYFECPPNHGLFTRTQKLTLVEKSDAPTPTPSGQAPQRNVQRESAPSQEKVNRFTPSDLKTLQNKLKIGDHVLVGGAKEGRLRYLGPTEFAKGIWAGVELPEPMGKNDGAVSGKRYFQCEPKHGIFAPLPKIEKLATTADSVSTRSAASFQSTSPTPPPISMPSPPGNVRAARGMGKPPSESSTSSFGVADQRVSSLQGSTAAGLSRLLQQREETIANLKTEMETERHKNDEELTNLRRQVEDLQFQLLEQGVISGDTLEKNAESSEQRLASLTSELDQERKRVRSLQDQLEQAAQGGSSGSDVLHSQLQEKSQELATQQDTIKKLERERSEAMQRTEELSHTASQREEEVVQVRQELSTLRDQLADVQHSLKTSDDQCKLLSQQKSSLEEQLDQLSKMSGDSSQQLTFLQDQIREKESQYEELHSKHSTLAAQLEQVQTEYQTHQTESSGQLSRLQAELGQERDRATSLEREITQTSVAASDIEEELQRTQADLKDAMELCSQHEVLIEERNQELSSLDSQVRKLTQAQDQWSNERSRLQSEQERLIAERDRALAECDQFMAQSASSSTEQNEMSRQRMELLSERDQLLVQQQALQTENEKLVGERDEVVHQLAKIQSDRQEAILNSQQLNSKFETTNMELTEALSEIEELKLELSQSKDNWEHEKLALREQVELAGANGVEMRDRIDHASSERDSALQQAQELAEQLDQTERERDQLQLSLEAAQGEVDELNYQMEEVNVRLLTNEQDAVAIQQRIETTEAILSERDRELAEAREQVHTLTEDLKASQGKTDWALLEEEKLLLEERVKELTIQLERAQQKSPARANVDKNVGGMNNEALVKRLEEVQTQLLEQQANNSDLQQQIEFLNSVIADLQRKLETAEALSGLHGPLEPEGGEYLEDDDDMVQGLPPPRLFCDICDVFDQHDTDDCPMQAGSDSPPPTMYHGTRGGSDRPYCVNCEMFGHATEECEYDATY